MADENSLTIRYEDHPTVRELIDVLTYCAEGVSIGFDKWDDPYVQGPGLYFVVVSGTSVAEYADPMGENRWPIEECRVVTDDRDAFFETARTVAVDRDGAVVISVDGVVHEQMVRVKDLSSDELADVEGDEHIEYADWMGARHMSALDASAREEVVATITLSEETGRVTIFDDGEYRDYTREELGGQWRLEE